MPIKTIKRSDLSDQSSIAITLSWVDQYILSLQDWVVSHIL